jgi:hypothetical protein
MASVFKYTRILLCSIGFQLSQRSSSAIVLLLLIVKNYRAEFEFYVLVVDFINHFLKF